MTTDLIFTIVSFVFCSGVVYGSLNNRIKNIEKMIQDNKDIGERLAKIETQTSFLIEQIKKITQ